MSKIFIAKLTNLQKYHLNMCDFSMRKDKFTVLFFALVRADSQSRSWPQSQNLIKTGAETNSFGSVTLYSI